MSEDGFREFVDARWPALVRFAWTLVGDRGHAEDLVETALERTWRRWRHVRDGGAEAYVRTAVVHLAISGSRRRRVRETALGEGLEPRGADSSPTAGADDLADERAVQDVVWVELQKLPPRMRAVVVLRFLEDQSEARTAELLGCSVGSVKSQTARAIAQLRERAGLRDLVGIGEAEGDLT